jgi:hypothetical protein
MRAVREKSVGKIRIVLLQAPVDRNWPILADARPKLSLIRWFWCFPQIKVKPKPSQADATMQALLGMWRMLRGRCGCTGQRGRWGRRRRCSTWGGRNRLGYVATTSLLPTCHPSSPPPSPPPPSLPSSPPHRTTNHHQPPITTNHQPTSRHHISTNYACVFLVLADHVHYIFNTAKQSVRSRICIVAVWTCARLRVPAWMHRPHTRTRTCVHTNKHTRALAPAPAPARPHARPCAPLCTTVHHCAPLQVVPAPNHVGLISV